jgi:hypothetical protein
MDIVITFGLVLLLALCRQLFEELGLARRKHAQLGGLAAYVLIDGGQAALPLFRGCARQTDLLTLNRQAVGFCIGSRPGLFLTLELGP